MCWAFGHKACRILAPVRPGIEPTPLALEGRLLITGPPGKFQDVCFINNKAPRCSTCKVKGVVNDRCRVSINSISSSSEFFCFPPVFKYIENNFSYTVAKRFILHLKISVSVFVCVCPQLRYSEAT